jgi:8-oxo-dGTP pyrophosphatase MutT (NUDIX family)
MIYFEPPTDFNPRFEIVSSYVTAQGKMLLLHRHNNKSQGGKWGEPAGKIDAGEKPLEAMVRELNEETGLVINPEQLTFFKTIYVRFLNEYDFTYHMFGLSFEAEPAININDYEHQSFTWVTPEEALKMNLVHDNELTIKMFFGI